MSREREFVGFAKLRDLTGRVAGRELSLRGSAAALLELAKLLASEPPPFEIRLYVTADADPHPYDKFLTSILRRQGGDTVRIAAHSDRLLLDGTIAAMAPIIGGLQSLAQLKPICSGPRLVPHVHFDAPSNDAIAKDSDDLIVSIMFADDASGRRAERG